MNATPLVCDLGMSILSILGLLPPYYGGGSIVGGLYAGQAPNKIIGSS